MNISGLKLMGKNKKSLSSEERLVLIQTLNALPTPQFNELVFALGLPRSNMPEDGASRSSQSKAILEWAESPIGKGLDAVELLLSKFISENIKESPECISFIIRGSLRTSTQKDIQHVVYILRQITGDDSINVVFSQEGSINLVLSGSSRGLQKLQELYASGELESLDISSVENVEWVGSDAPEARKALLIKSLRLREQFLSFANVIDVANDVANDLSGDLASLYGRDPTVSISLSRIRSLLYLLGNIRSHISPRARAHAIDSARTRAHVIWSDLSLWGSNIPSNVLERFRTLDRALSRSLEFDIGRDLDLDLDLTNADFRGANMRKVNLIGADLTGADFSDADVVGTLFGDNKGLLNVDKRNLKERGAIFHDSPEADVPVLIKV
ncbi:MAG: pentapeptide repeat-containing protein [Cyanobacteria bacterium J06650_10]